jgi:hypothetical protein
MAVNTRPVEKLLAGKKPRGGSSYFADFLANGNEAATV